MGGKRFRVSFYLFLITRARPGEPQSRCGLLLQDGLEVHEQVYFVVDLEFFVDVGDVGADGVDADVQLLGDLLVLFAGG